MDQRNLVTSKSQNRHFPLPKITWLWDILLVLVILLGAYLRFIGIDWDDNFHLHPDERFLTMVESSIESVDSINQYFDTSTSTLNPNNRGYSFYVYGNFPLFLVRYLGEWLKQTGYTEIYIVGRYVSGCFDLGTILLVYLIGRRLFRNPRLGLFASLLYSLSVLAIQLSHFFTVDTTATFFATLTVYFAVLIFMPNREIAFAERKAGDNFYWVKNDWKSFIFYALFAFSYGIALASKVSIYPLALLLPLAGYLLYCKMDEAQQHYAWPIIFRNLALAAIIAFLTFRFFQPYAFVGPSFFDFKINPQWINGLKELAAQSDGSVDVPYALQWVRRPVTFGFENTILWGMGLTFGILAVVGFLWMTWRIIKGDWQKYILLCFWTAIVCVIQALTWNCMMRYMIQIYPTLAIIAAWVIFKLWDEGSVVVGKLRLFRINWKRLLAVLAAIVVALGSAAWAFAFSRIYTRPVTRVAASEWVYQNIPGAINLQISTGTGDDVTEPVSYRNGTTISEAQPFVYVFSPSYDEELTQIKFEHIRLEQPEGATLSLVATISREDDEQGTIIASGFVQSDFALTDNDRGNSVIIQLINPIQLEVGQKYKLTFQIVESDGSIKVLGDVDLEYSDGNQIYRQYLAAPAFTITPTTSFQNSFIPVEDGVLDSITINRGVDLLQNDQKKSLTVTVVDSADQNTVLATGSLRDAFAAANDPRGESKEILLDKPVVLDHTHNYILQFSVQPLEDGSGTALAFYNNVLATESSWDDAIPLSMHGYDVWGNENGLYGNNKNFEIYWDDNEAKLNRIEDILNQSDTIIITSNRQWGTITRVNERYPLSTEYYRQLIGCPTEKDLLWCYQVAEPGMFTGALGFELSEVFTSNPNIGSFEINDQSAEEAFTVYDHPKVLIFQKMAGYDADQVDEILGVVDLTKVVHPTLQESDKFAGNLYLSAASASIQQLGGTWTEIFDFCSKVSSNQWVIAAFWYLVIALLGWIMYPFVHWALKALPDHGFPLSRLVGMLLLALFTWLASSNGAHFTRTTILIMAAILFVGNAVLAFLQRKELAEELKKRKWYFLTVELIFLAFFLIDLGIRWGNPDLWHPWKGGEKPMDLSYFTAVIKSTTFPPYDPWFAGGYINYYYYGFIILAVPVKLLGIVPSIAYNLVLPTLFGLTAIGSFSVVWNLVQTHSERETEDHKTGGRSYLGGLLSAFFVLIIGNLGTLRMLWQGVQRLAAPNGNIDGAVIFQRIGWFFSGLLKFLQGARLSYGTGDWYWIPSRAIAGDVITEFPFFTFTYADLHAHMIALPITILALSWVLSILLGKWKWGNTRRQRVLSFCLSFGLGGVVIGALRPTNTWDLPVYLCLAAIIILYVIFRYADLPDWFLPKSPAWFRRASFAVINIAILTGLVLLLYSPFTKWYGQSYGSIDKWSGDHSALSDYLTHWGFFFFLILSWFIWETREWMASTPASALKGLKPYLVFLQIILILIILVLVLFAILGVKIGWVAFPMMIWALVLLLRPNQPDAKRLVLFMIGTALFLTLFVELFNLQGDIGRMNTVFKFYYQAWTLLAISSAASIIWLIPAVITKWRGSTSMVWQIVLAFLVFGVLLYPVTAAEDKIHDRMSETAIHTLDGMEYMKTSVYGDQDTVFDLNQDYAAIKWMQENVSGSPVIVEGNTVEYRWGNRYTIYTGLPGVLGWNWHQRQQRGYLSSNEVYHRIEEITMFYSTISINNALDFLNTYNVKYIVLGQLERAYYPGDGLNKFEKYDGVYWKEVFRQDQTIIYEVIAQD
jgi:YYY domain-containing protein